ncbi:MAG: tetratricopeptide repeat protein, partial [Gammaproteobacteria bacterium]|nr:tetratricopeptide repeat protein [Gammaproteobacteria bacterium]
MLTIEKWNCEGKVSRIEDWERANQYLSIANRLAPWDADILLNLGKLQEWKLASKSLWNDKAEDVRGKAINYYEQALEQRPTWANAWVNLAQTMLLNRQVNDKTYHAIEMGFLYGEQKPELREKLIWLSVGLWKYVP